MKQHLFTFTLVYKEGIYLWQYRAANVTEAFAAWADQVDFTPVKGIGEKSRAVVKREIEIESFPPLKGFDNVWTSFFRVRGDLAMLYCVTTLGCTV
jgi:hypothetical protein